MKNTRDEIIKYSFTKYVDVAVMRARKDYINKEKKHADMEELSELDVNLRKTEEAEHDQAGELLSLDPEQITFHLSRFIGTRMYHCLECLTASEIQIVYLKVFQGCTFVEIGETLKMDWKKVASVYSYARRKMQKGWETDDI